MATPPSASADTILFRPSKKRKVYRQRAADDEEISAAILPTTSTPLSPATNPQILDELISSAASNLKDGGEEVEGVLVSMAEILRMRKMKKRAGGVEFRAETQSYTPKDESQALVPHTESSEGAGGKVENGIPRKFAAQTGAVGDVNRHM